MGKSLVPEKKTNFTAKRLIVVFSIAALLGPAAAYAKAEPAQAKSECIACHTDLNRIVPLISEIEKVRPESRKSAEVSGEG